MHWIIEEIARKLGLQLNKGKNKIYDSGAEEQFKTKWNMTLDDTKLYIWNSGKF